MAESRRRQAAPAPLVPLAGAMIVGIIAGRYAHAPPGAWALLAVGAWGAGALAMRRPHLAAFAGGAIALAAASIGAILFQAAHDRVPRDHVAAFLPRNGGGLATLTGRIVTMPAVETPAPQDRFFSAYERPPETVFLLEADAVSTAGGPVRCRGLVRVSVQEPTWQFEPGQRVRIAGRVYRPGPPGNPGQYDWRARARSDGVLVHCAAEAADGVEVLEPAGGVARQLWRLRCRARQHLQADGAMQNTLLLRTLILGDRHAALDPLNEAMLRSGTAHLLSISGQHLTILLGFLYLLMRLAALTPRRAAMAVLVLLAGYLLVADAQAPLLRSALMAAAFCLAVILGRSASTANLLAAAAIALLAADPRELFRAGFQLSFGTVAGILLLYRPVERLLFGRWLGRRGLMVFRDEQRIRRWFNDRGALILIRSVSVSIAAYLASVPLVAYHFGLLTPLAPLATLVLLPVVALTLVAGYLQLLAAWAVPNLAASLSPALAGLTGATSALAGVLGSVPGTALPLRPVPVWAALAMAAAMAAAAQRARLGISRAWATTGLVAVVGIVAVATQAPPSATAEAELCVLDVRRGNCAVLRAPDGRTYLFDAGTISGFDPDRHVLAPFLRARGWPDPSAAFVSHANTDHFNALPGLLERSGLPELFVHDAFVAAAEDGGAARVLLRQCTRAGTSVHLVQRGRRVRLDERTSVTVLWPPPAATGHVFEEANDSSLVLRLECDGLRVLIPGDIEHLAQSLLLGLPPEELRADVLILPHHGGYSPVLAEFVSAVRPRCLIRSSVPRHGDAEAQVPALSAGREFLSTDTDGCIRVRFTREGLVVVPHRGR